MYAWKPARTLWDLFHTKVLNNFLGFGQHYFDIVFFKLTGNAFHHSDQGLLFLQIFFLSESPESSLKFQLLISSIVRLQPKHKPVLGSSSQTFLHGDLTDQNSLLRCLKESNPNEVYNLASQSFVGQSWNIPEQTSDVTGLGVLRMLEAIRHYGKKVKFYHQP